jgi:CelD/BcsL family acetyltransferase involved in cellulose biosynthesis
VTVRLLPIRLDSPDADALDRVAAFVQSSPEATVFHTPTWNRIVAEVFGTDFTYLAAMEGETIAGAMPVHVVKQPGGGDVCYSPPRLFEVAYGGPLAATQGSVSEALVRAAARLGHRAAVDVFCGPQNSAWAEASGLGSERLETAHVDLAPELDEIWMKSVDSKRRNMVRKAEKSGVEVLSCGAEGLPEYLAMVEETVERAGFAAQPADYYAKVIDALAPSDGARLYIARRDGRSLAGGIFLRHGAYCYYWHGATARDAGNFGQSEMIQWEVIKWAKTVGCEVYDLVGIERERLPNVARFKLGFTKQVVPFRYVHFRRLPDRVVLKLRRSVFGRSAG